MLDAHTSHLLDINASAKAYGSFWDAWHDAQRAREARGAALADDHGYWASLYGRLDVSLRVRPRSSACTSATGMAGRGACIGVDDARRCVCYKAAA